MNHSLLKALIVAMTTSALPTMASADEFTVGGITYEAYSDEATAVDYDNKTPDVSIPATVSYNGRSYIVSYMQNGIFQDRDALVSISVDPAVSHNFSSSAFENCVNLQSVSADISQISENMFYNCPKLDIRPLMANATEIGYGAFAMPEPLICATFDSSVLKEDCYIHENAFNNRLFRDIICSSEHVYRMLDKSETETMTVCYDDAWWTQWDVMEKLKTLTVNGRSFGTYECNAPALTYIVLGERVENFGITQSFENLQSMDMSEASSLTDFSIHGNEHISSISLPSSVTNLNLYEMNALTEVSGTENVKTVQVHQCPLVERLYLPAIEELIGESFYKNKSLKEVYLGNTLRYVSHGAFESTKNMEDLIYGGTLEEWNSIEYDLSEDYSNSILYNIPRFWYGHGNTKHTCLYELNDLGSATAVTEGAFTGYKGLTKVSLPASVTTMQPYAFAGCTNLTDVSLKAEKISQFSFQMCTALTHFTLGYQISYIGPAFQSSNAKDQTLTVYYGGEFEQWQKVTRDPHAYENGEYAGYPYYGSCNLMAIANGGFYFNGKLIETAIFDDPEEIDNILAGNKSLKSVVINCSNGIPHILPKAFQNCSGLTSIVYTLNNMARSSQGFVVGDQAFYGCPALTEIGILDNLESVGLDVFNFTGWYYAQAGAPVYINTKTQGKCAYVYSGVAPEGTIVKFDDDTETILGSTYSVSGHAGITGAILPEGLKEIGGGAFSGTNISGDLVIPSSVETVGWTSGSFKFDSFTIADSETPLTDIQTWGTEMIKNIYIGRDIDPASCGNIFSYSRWENAVETLTFGPYVTKVTESTAIGDSYKASGLKHIYALATNPPVCSEATDYDWNTNQEKIIFPGLEGIDYDTCVLHVPSSSLDAYKAAPGWNLFKNITGETVDVEEVISTPATGIDLHYDLQGRPITPDAPGLHIIRHSNGSVTKALII